MNSRSVGATVVARQRGGPVKKAIGGLMPTARRPMGAMGKPRPAMLAQADRTLASANQRLAGMPGTRKTIGTGARPMAMAKGGLSRMHFKRGADIIKSARERAKAAGATDFSHIDDINSEMEKWFSESNPNFKRDRYRKAAGYED